MSAKSTLFLAALLIASFSQKGMAADVCERLRDRLVSTANVDTRSLELDRYSSAIAQQNLELRKARQDYRNLRCETSSVVVYRSDGGNACKDQRRAIQRMEANRDILTEKLQALRTKAQSGGDQRAEIINALGENGCNSSDDLSLVNFAEPERVPYLDTVPEAQRVLAVPQPSFPTAFAVPPGPLRTLCVRTCDGAFFPISSRASAVDFVRDADQCQQMCPNVQTELYFHSLTAGDTANMVSASTGQPYRNMPNAFRYRNSSSVGDSQCSCNLSAYYEKMQKQQQGAKAVPDYQSSLLRLEQPSVPNATEDATPTPIERPMEAADRRVRQVGPVFLPPDNQEIDLRNPASQGPQPLQD